MAKTVSRAFVGRAAGCMVAVGLAAGLLTLAAGRVEGGPGSSPERQEAASAPAEARTPFASAQATPAYIGPRRDPRIPLYVVEDEESARRLARGVANTAYVELNGGNFSSWEVMVLSEGITFQMLEEMNIARISSGLIPYKIIDARTWTP